MNRSITELSTYPSISVIDYPDLLLYARAQTPEQNIGRIKNYNTSLETFVDAFKNYSKAFPIDFSNTFINNNNVKSKVKNQTVDASNIQSFVFNEYGCITDYTLKQADQSKRKFYLNGILPKERQRYTGGAITLLDFAIASEDENAGIEKVANKVINYFPSYNVNDIGSLASLTVPETQQVTLTTVDGVETTGNWDLLFLLDFSGYRKTVINMRTKSQTLRRFSTVTEEYNFVIDWVRMIASGNGMVSMGPIGFPICFSYLNTIEQNVAGEFFTIKPLDSFKDNPTKNNLTFPDLLSNTFLQDSTLTNEYGSNNVTLSIRNLNFSIGSFKNGENVGSLGQEDIQKRIVSLPFAGITNNENRIVTMDVSNFA